MIHCHRRARVLCRSLHEDTILINHLEHAQLKQHIALALLGVADRATAMTSLLFHFHMANSNSIAHSVGPPSHFFTN